ncbi:MULTISPECIES: RNA polymerase sigma-70 factor [Parabacteroides]|uniref:RNA polymerase sigma-70 factor n=1 Tax=Parabacteroides distasonis TaxID=823 RepID=A0A3L7ZTN1_PARDI|nr:MULTISPECIES: RNA polymerase sigma-70 factor [Parabacteroides]NBH89435.1 RNA polymerase sigma-70 factor [Parabacteroides distasonis]RLT74297.1 RNA polymerase sigma-70 factor [Parabacteroides distasonis]TGY56034.1 RNA polymerase sigma-70 factor [Parabacteroides distasonis]
MNNKTSLVERIRKGDRIAFNELYRRYYPSLRSYAELFLDEEESEDVVQDVFLNVWLRKEGLDDSLSLQGYLLRSVYNSSLNILKKKGRSNDYRSMYEQEIEEIGYKYYDPDTNDVIRKLYNQDLRAEINAAINSLPARCREIFTLSYLHDMPSKEISLQLGISLSTVDNHIYSALKLLREKLKIHYNINKKDSFYR